MEQRHFARLQRYIVRFATDEADVKATIEALTHVNWKALYMETPQKPTKPKRERLTKEEKQEQAEQFRALPYSEYLQTPYWHTRRATAIKIARGCCQVCNRGKVKLNVHHRTYERLGCELNSDLIVLCETCHEIFHKNGKLAG